MLCQFALSVLVEAQKLPPPFWFPDPNSILEQVTAAGILAGWFKLGRVKVALVPF
jgi:hypothetical protein